MCTLENPTSSKLFFILPLKLGEHFFLDGFFYILRKIPYVTLLRLNGRGIVLTLFFSSFEFIGRLDSFTAQWTVGKLC